MSRLDELKAARDLMWESIQVADPEKRAPLMNQWRALEATIAELSGAGASEGTGLSEFERRLAERGGSAKGARSASRR